MPANPLTGSCAHCSKPLKGRIDKKFCDDWCRNAYNNRLSSLVPAIVRLTNNTLRRNRKLLQAQIPEGKTTIKVQRKKLLEQGFNFEFFTSLYTTQKGHTYHFCYEYGYLDLDNDFLLVVNRSKADSAAIVAGN